MFHSASPYLKPNRLGDVIAAVQAMASSEYYRRSCDQWSITLSGTKDKSKYWQTVFDEHGEFFRHSPATDDDGTGERYSLVWRRALPHVHITTGEPIRYRDYEQLTEKEKQNWPRARLPDAAVTSMIQIAIDMHSKAVEENRDWRWWIPSVTSFIGAFLGFIAAALFKGH